MQRCLLEPTRVKVTRFTEDELRAQEEAYLASLPQPKPIPDPQPEPDKAKPKLVKLFNKRGRGIWEKWTRLLDMITKGRLEVLRMFWEREGEAPGVNATVPECTGGKRASLLQVAARSGQEEVTQWMLEEQRADPTIAVGEEAARRTAYELASTKGVRDVFRRCATVHEEWWDWFGAGRVPSALSKEMEEQRDEKRKIRRKGLKEKIRERKRAVGDTVDATPEPVVPTASGCTAETVFTRLGSLPRSSGFHTLRKVFDSRLLSWIGFCG